MPIKWILRDLLRQLEIKKASEISRIIYDRTGYRISTQAVCDLLNDKPKMLRLDTAQAFCDAFGLRLGDFCEIVPGPPRKLQAKSSNFRPLNLTGAGSDDKHGQHSGVSANEAGGLDLASFFFAAGELNSLNQPA
ncbi:MAG TPA: helix-turn-helix transcriptional regulator [Pyrinomonadaceae bacterium]|nr:helix-turn-helix transcriptional regulator [Pyrinomonadaceae bacterium]